jgi:aspartyl-tRNA(Asn)/glutamyl-tRNA(Gln) amidotransferase subunit A
VNFLDGCAATIPCHAPGEAPVGLMLSGVAMTDRRVLAVARSAEGVLGKRA